MKIGILGTGYMGKTLARKLAAAGHDVKVANSRGPDSIAADVLETGARAAVPQEAVSDVDVAILSIPFANLESVRALIAALPEDVVVIDTANYVPQRDGAIAAIDAGQAESEWVQELLGRGIAKAWNAIGSASFANNGGPKGQADRIAIPVAGDNAHDRAVAISLVEDTGFDGFDAGTMAESWRQQPGSPAYCTDLTYSEIGAALASAERDRLPKRRDLGMAVMGERLAPGENPTAEYGRRISRALFM